MIERLNWAKFHEMCYNEPGGLKFECASDVLDDLQTGAPYRLTPGGPFRITGWRSTLSVTCDYDFDPGRWRLSTLSDVTIRTYYQRNGGKSVSPETEAILEAIDAETDRLGVSADELCGAIAESLRSISNGIKRRLGLLD